jgi:hypothetical protein
MCDLTHQFILITLLCLSLTRACNPMVFSLLNVLILELVVRFADIIGHHCLTFLFLIYITDFCNIIMHHYVLHVLAGSW